MCECFKVGGPFISEDPDCPVHGVNGIQRQVENLICAWNELPDELRLDPRLDALGEAVRVIYSN